MSREHGPSTNTGCATSRVLSIDDAFMGMDTSGEQALHSFYFVHGVHKY
jgi:hypothetical protein